MTFKEKVAIACKLATVDVATLAERLGVDRSNLYRKVPSGSMVARLDAFIDANTPIIPAEPGVNGVKPATEGQLATTKEAYGKAVEGLSAYARQSLLIADWVRRDPQDREEAIALLATAAQLSAEQQLDTPDSAFAQLLGQTVFNAVEVNMFRRRRVAWQEQLALVVANACFCKVFAIAKKNNIRFVGAGSALAVFVYRRLMVFAENQSLKDRQKFWGDQFKLNGHRRGLQGYRPEWLVNYTNECIGTVDKAFYEAVDGRDHGPTMGLAILDDRHRAVEQFADPKKFDGVLVVE